MEVPAGKVKNRFPNNYFSSDTGYDVLKTAVIVGEKAGGKTNFINSIKFLKSLFDNNAPVKTICSYVNSHSLMENQDVAQKYEMTILCRDGVIYTYSLSIDKDSIISERLDKQTKRRSTSITVFQIDRNENGKYVFVNGAAEKRGNSYTE